MYSWCMVGRETIHPAIICHAAIYGAWCIVGRKNRAIKYVYAREGEWGSPGSRHRQLYALPPIGYDKSIGPMDFVVKAVVGAMLAVCYCFL